MKKESYMHNSFILARRESPKSQIVTLFDATVGDSRFYLNGYATIPIEEYAKLTNGIQRGIRYESIVAIAKEMGEPEIKLADLLGG